MLKRGPDAPWMPNLWNLPGGVDDNETPPQAAKRELKEETGIVTDLTYLTKIGDIWAFIGWVTEPEVEINFESSEYRWIKRADLYRLEFVVPVRQILEICL